MRNAATVLALILLAACDSGGGRRDAAADASTDGDASLDHDDAGATPGDASAPDDGEAPEPVPVQSWAVFTSAGEIFDTANSLVGNPSFEAGGAGTATGWAPTGAGYLIDAAGGQGGGRALLLNNIGTGVGAYAVAAVSQTEPAPLYVAGTSRASDVTGNLDHDYSIYVDVHYTDGSWLYGETVRFDTGTHDWQRRERVIMPEKPIETVYVYCLLRGAHTGRAWFDDVTVTTSTGELLVFDGKPVVVAEAPALDPDLTTLSSGDGLSIGLTEGGAVRSIKLDGAEQASAEHAFMGGFLVRDVGARSAWLHPGGNVESTEAGVVTQHGPMPELGLDFTARYEARSDRIDVHAELSADEPGDRAITLYFALPFGAGDYTWGNDIQRAQPLAGTSELSNVSYEREIGATGALSRYPWGLLSGADGSVVMAYSLAAPRVARFVANPFTRQLFVAFDLGLTGDTAKFPQKAWVDFTLFASDGAWGFRAATEGYHARFPRTFFARDSAPAGIWMPFTSLSSIPDVADFGFAVHELASLDQVAADSALGVKSFRYLSEPWSHWLGLSTPNLDPSNASHYDLLIDELKAQAMASDEATRRKAEATLSSGFFDADGKYRYVAYGPGQVPWCPGSSGCALFAVNADPGISDAMYPTNKANLEWNEAARAAGDAVGLSGEYIDSVQGNPFRMFLDQRRAHFATASEPITFAGEAHELGIPSLFATTAYLHWLAEQVHGEGRLFMANTVLEDLPWGSDVFDYMGVETSWIQGGELVPDSDAHLAYRRTLSGDVPYGFLMNTDFDAMGADGRVERYFQICAFYGIYPSFFSPNAADSPYWEKAEWYERDRALFVKYVPLIRALNRAGWQPVTLAKSSNPVVYVERWGDTHFTLRSTSDSAITITLTLDDALTLPVGGLAPQRLIDGAGALTVSAPRTLDVALAPLAVEIVRLGE